MKTNKKFYQEVGIELKRFIKKEFKSQKRAAMMFGISESLLSKYIKGNPEPPARFVTALTDRYGFPKEPFIKYYSLTEVAPETLTKDEMIRVVYEYQLLLKRRDEYQNKIEESFNKLMNQFTSLNKSLNDILKENLELKRKLMRIEQEKFEAEMEKFKITKEK